MFLKVSPQKGTIRFRRRVNLGPRYIILYKVIAHVGKVTDSLPLPEEPSLIHKTFHISQLRKCLVDETSIVPLDDIQVDDKLSYFKRLVVIFECKMKMFHYKEIGIVKV